MSTKLARTITVPGSVEDVFDYVADFSNAAEWDPGVAAARAQSDASTGVGSVYELTVTFKGRKLETRYRTVEYDRPNTVTFKGGTSRFTSIDTITFTPRGDDVEIRYAAEFILKGLFRFGEPFLKGTFNKTADDAVAGLSDVLKARAAKS